MSASGNNQRAQDENDDNEMLSNASNNNNNNNNNEENNGSRIGKIIRELQEMMPRASPKDLLAAAQAELNATSGSSMTTTGDTKDRPLSHAIKAIRDMPKLTMDNWHPWKRSLKINLQTVDNAIETITKEIDQDNDEYDQALDLKLGAAINGVLQLDGQRGVEHIVTKINKAGKLLGSRLYPGLERELTKQDAVARASLFAKANKIRMYNNDVDKLSMEINELWTQSIQLGSDLGEALKILTLIRCIM